MKRRRWCMYMLVLAGFAVVALVGMAAELARREAHYYDSTSALRGSVTPQGETDLRLSGRKISSWPPIVGTWVITARGTHRSWTNTPIAAIGVEGDLTLTAGGETYSDSESDGWLNGDEAEAVTYVESEGVPGNQLLDAEGTASSEHDFYDSRLGGWVFLYTSVSGGL